MLSEPIQTFVYSLKSRETQKQYLLYLGYFVEWHKKKIDSLLKLDSKIIEKILIQYIMSMRGKGLSSAYVKGRMSPVVSFLELNDISVNKKKIGKFYAEYRKTVRDEAYTREDIQKMIQYASFRVRVMILIYSSTGIRRSALIDLKLKHLEKVETSQGIKLYKFRIYENTKEEYTTFCTPECANAIDQYIDKRKSDGEKITQESFLIRNDYDANRGGAGTSYSSIRNPKPLNKNNLMVLIPSLLTRINFRQRNHVTENYKYQRQNKSTFHAFRKFFNTCLGNCDVNVTIKEMMMGHSTGLDDTYYKPNEKQMLSEYSKAINELTISDENRLRIENEIMKEERDEIKMLASRIQLLEKQLKSSNGNSNGNGDVK